VKLEVIPELRPLIERGERAYQQFYVGALKDTLERTSKGKYVAINIETGEHVVADSEEDAMAQLRARFPDVIAYTLRVGMPRLIA